MKKLVCEFLGTLVLVLFGCGVAVFTDASIVATSLAFSGGKYQNIYYTPLRQCGNYYYTTISVD